MTAPHTKPVSEIAGKKPTKAMVAFCKKHLRRDLAKNGRLTKWAGQQSWPFVDRCRAAGLIEIVDPDHRFPYNWQATQLTDKGRELAA